MKRIMFWILVGLLGFLAVECSLYAQTISPVAAEGGKGKMSGQYNITNNGLIPAPVTVEPKSFDVHNGKPVYRPLDAASHVELEEMSARLGPKESHTFYFKVQCDVLPCNIALLSSMTIGKTVEGLQVRVILPFSVYLCQKTKGCRESVIAASK